MTYYSANHYSIKAEKSMNRAESAATRAETAAAQASQSSGKIVQLGFDGAMQDGVLVFTHAPSGVEVPYELLDDYEYELDLSYNSLEDLSGDVQMYVKNGNDTVTFVSALHRDSTSYATVDEMSSVMRFNADTGYRWLFKAAYKIAPNGTKVLLLYPVISSGGAGAGLEIGDIGFAPLGIDEAQNKRRYLNGQVISQAQFVSFTNKIKSAIELYPNLATSETNWQAEVTNSKLGQCGKFVIDDELGTIRLPKVVNINGLQDLALMGSIKAESLPNIKGEIRDINSWNQSPANGAFSGTNTRDDSFSGGTGKSYRHTVYFNASNSSSTYQDNAPVQQEAVQYPYFIQVATGVEESVDVTREIELNNPFSLLDYKWSEYEITNASWLISNGTFHSGATYVAVYELLLKIHNGTETKDGVSVKLSTEEYTDTDFVLNTADTTFRLPIKVKLASGNMIVGNGKALGITNGTTDYITARTDSANSSLLAYRNYSDNNLPFTQSSASGVIGNAAIGITTDATKSGIETSSNGLKLYFYVGETVQDANVIAASQVLTTVADCVKKSSATDRETVVGWGMPDYSAGITVPYPTSASKFTAPVSGVYVVVTSKEGDNIFYVNGVSVFTKASPSSYVDYLPIFIPLAKGDVVYFSTSAYATKTSVFYPLKGVN